MTAALAIVVVLILGWFVVGTFWNVRKGSAVMRWMQDGLPRVGERTTVRWLGTTSVEMVIDRAKPPFERVKLVIVLEPRDVPWFWWVARLRGRRDTLILRAQLRSSPRADLDVVDRASWANRDALRRIASGAWSVREPLGPDGLPVYYTTEAGLGRSDTLLEVARSGGLALQRLAVSRTEPHLQLHLDLPTASMPASDFFETLRALGECAGG
jgi:hypothetical protein